MATVDPVIEKRGYLVFAKKKLGELSEMVRNRLETMNNEDQQMLSKKLVSYVLKHELEGGPLTDQVMIHTYVTIHDLLGTLNNPEVESE